MPGTIRAARTIRNLAVVPSAIGVAMAANSGCYTNCYTRPLPTAPERSQSPPCEFASNHQPLDLGRAFPDLIDLGIAVPFFDGEVADVAVAAQDLDGVVGDAHGHVAGFELGHARLAGEGPTLGGGPGGSPDQQADRVYLGGHVGQLEGDGLVRSNRLAERAPLQRVIQGVLVRGAGNAKRAGGHAGSG